MSGRPLRVISRIIFVLCGVASLFTGVPYAMLQGISLPYQSEWVIFVIALGILGVFGLVAGLMQRAWLARLCKADRDDEFLFLTPLKWLGRVAATFYIVAAFAYFAPHTWNLNPQLMLALCPMYLVRLTFDPSPVLVFFLLAPMNAAVFGSLGLLVAFAWLRFSRASIDARKTH